MLAWLPELHGDPSLMVLALVAAMVNGAIGYGFSTLVVPVALLLYPSKTLTPGLVLAEIVLNLLALLVNRRAVPAVFWRVFPMMLASLPGIALGVTLLKNASPDTLRFGTYALLLPLVLLQAAGLRRPLPKDSRAELPVGFGIGVLYSCTTISGPPLGLLFNNQGLAQDEFRAAISLFRITESVATALAFAFLSIYTPASVSLSLQILPCILIGLPIGRLAIAMIDPETFRRICMAADAWLISFGLSRLLTSYGSLSARLAYVPMLAVLILDGVILYRFFQRRRIERKASAAQSQHDRAGDRSNV
jgi:uncharacterized membrane protein YfcA